MKKAIKFIGNLIFFILSAILITYIVGIQFFSEPLKELIGYQTFVILTDSMEPTIPVGSLVVCKNIDEDQVIPKDTIISFQVEWLNEDVVFTHYFKKIVTDETGKKQYLTQAENADRYDDYVTYREDILGTYVFHVPYVGKFVLFLQSPFALIELGIILFILLINRILWNRFDRQEQEALAESAETASDIVLDTASVDETDISSDIKTVVPNEVLESPATLTEVTFTEEKKKKGKEKKEKNKKKKKNKKIKTDKNPKKGKKKDKKKK